MVVGERELGVVRLQDRILTEAAKTDVISGQKGVVLVTANVTGKVHVIERVHVTGAAQRTGQNRVAKAKNTEKERNYGAPQDRKNI